MTTVTSLTLLEALGGGRDERAWREFFRLYAPLLMGFTRQLGFREEDANDAVQETRVMKRIKSIFADIGAMED